MDVPLSVLETNLQRRDPACLEEESAEGGSAVSVEVKIKGRAQTVAFQRWSPRCHRRTWGLLWQALGPDVDDDDEW